MDYQSIYDRIIERNRNTPKIKKQTEDHHIIPRSFATIDGIEDINGSWNKVNLPIRDHFIVHLLLARIWRSHKIKGPKMAKAFRIMSNYGKYTSKDYSWLKLNYNHSEETKIKIGKSNTGKKRTLESKEHMSLLKRGIPKTADHKHKISQARKGKIISEETRHKLSEAGKKRKHSEETKQKMSEINKGKTLSEETKKKMSEIRKGKVAHNKGKQCSEETKKKISSANKGKLKGKPLSAETKKKISETKRKRLNT